MGSAVVDANVMLEVVLQRENEHIATEALADIERVAPAICLAECANALRIAVSADVLSGEDAQRSIEFIVLSLTILSDEDLYPRILELAVAADHPAYDAAYVALAEHHDLPLLTFDKDLARKFAKVAPQVAIVDLGKRSNT